MNPRWKRQWNITTVEIQMRMEKMVEKWNGGNNANEKIQGTGELQTNPGDRESEPNGEVVQRGTGNQSTDPTETAD